MEASPSSCVVTSIPSLSVRSGGGQVSLRPAALRLPQLPVGGLGAVRGVWGDPPRPPVDQEAEEDPEEAAGLGLGHDQDVQRGEEEEDRAGEGEGGEEAQC